METKNMSLPHSVVHARAYTEVDNKKDKKGGGMVSVALDWGSEKENLRDWRWKCASVGFRCLGSSLGRSTLFFSLVPAQRWFGVDQGSKDTVCDGCRLPVGEQLPITLLGFSPQNIHRWEPSESPSRRCAAA